MKTNNKACMHITEKIYLILMRGQSLYLTQYLKEEGGIFRYTMYFESKLLLFPFSHKEFKLNWLIKLHDFVLKILSPLKRLIKSMIWDDDIFFFE